MAKKKTNQTVTSSIIISNRENGSRRVQMTFEGQGRTHQEFAREANINHIVKRWLATGQPPVVSQKNPLYADFTGPVDFQQQLDRVLAAQEAFELLPSAVRDLVDNDPAVFLAEMDTEEGREALAEAGLRIARDPNGNEALASPGEPLPGASPGTPKEPPASDKSPEEGSKSGGETPAKA